MVCLCVAMIMVMGMVMIVIRMAVNDEAVNDYDYDIRLLKCQASDISGLKTSAV